MKSTIKNPVGAIASALLLTWLTACGQAQTPATDTKVAAPSAPAAAPAVPPGSILYAAQPTGSKMTIAGTSTIHDWTMVSGIVGGSILADAKFPDSALTDSQAATPAVQVFTPTKSFKSGDKKMDSSMYEYLKEPEFKRMQYRLIELKPKSAPGSTGPLKFEAVGALTVVGVTVTNTMPVTIEKTDGKLKITGTLPLKCTDFKLKPFRFLVLSCGDDLTINFEWLLAAKAP